MRLWLGTRGIARREVGMMWGQQRAVRGDHWPGSAWSQWSPPGSGLQAPAHKITGSSLKGLKINEVDISPYSWDSRIQYSEIVDHTFQKYNELWFEHDELSVRVTSLRLWVYEWGAEWIFVISQALHAKFLWHDAGAAIIMRIFWHIHNEDGTKVQDLSASVNIRIKKDVSLNK